MVGLLFGSDLSSYKVDFSWALEQFWQMLFANVTTNY